MGRGRIWILASWLQCLCSQLHVQFLRIIINVIIPILKKAIRQPWNILLDYFLKRLAWYKPVRCYLENFWLLGAFSIGNADHMGTKRTPLRKYFIPPQGQPLSLFLSHLKIIFHQCESKSRRPDWGAEGLSSSRQRDHLGRLDDESCRGAEPF